MNGKVQHIGTRRSQGWWEPTFDPSLEGKLSAKGWDFDGTTGPKRAFLSGERLSEHAKDGEVLKFSNLTFEECDIQGEFLHRPSILFDDCRFHGCDFSYSEWFRATFRNCQFKRCSLALTTFDECEFRDCEWEDIGLQGSKTDFIRTFITDPDKLVFAGFSGTKSDHRSPAEHASHQAYRLEGTKAHVARTLLFSHAEVGDDKTYYQTAKLHDLQQMRAKIAQDIYNFKFGNGAYNRIKGAFIVPHVTEMGLLHVLGGANQWGASLLRPIIGLFFTFVVFSLIYSSISQLGAGDNYIQKSFDISILAGYGNQVNSQQNLALRIVEGVHLLIAILFYTVFFSTAVTRNGRTR